MNKPLETVMVAYVVFEDQSWILLRKDAPELPPGVFLAADTEYVEEWADGLVSWTVEQVVIHANRRVMVMLEEKSAKHMINADADDPRRELTNRAMESGWRWFDSNDEL